MKSTSEILALIQQLEDHIADDLEGQDLDFKQWNDQSPEENIKKMIKYAVCMANGGGGSVVYGVADRVTGLENVLKGVPLDVDIYTLQKRIYAYTDPHIIPFFDEVFYRDDSIRILIMHVYPGKGMYTAIDGTATIRRGKSCLPYRKDDE